ncbi:WGR domain-containing protein [Sphingobacterium bambusae]|uniref:WGR domain-containing protein n=1 Tax=Sphingobacterium bambusae TaxID=662858 RepID=A0ABW6BGW8_9SPHI|nr:WGR domain-containing protein [Sphingobacterium bambusae]WPL47482.1 WGR domain-containing protein [Sphingobacterium bambusae]
MAKLLRQVAVSLCGSLKDNAMKMKFYILTILAFSFFSCSTDKKQTIEDSNSMLKLYKRIDNQLYYWETWDKNEKSAIVHWGIVGQTGQNREVKSGLFSDFRKAVQKEIDEKLKEGYAEFDEDNYAFLDIEYKVDGFGTEKDLDKRHRLEEKMDEVLGWTGLGHTDG